MRCTDAKSALADRLDDLLERNDAEALDAHLETCATCRAALARAKRVREAIYRPWPVATPTPRVHAPGRRRGRVAATLLRYAAVFAAGVLVAQWVGATQPESPSSIESPPTVEAPSIPPSEDANAVPFPRRIR